MHRWPLIGILPWAVAMDLYENPAGDEEAAQSAIDTSHAYEAMGLVLYQAREVAQGLEHLAEVVRLNFPGLLPSAIAGSDLDAVRAVHQELPGLLDERTGGRGDWLVQGLRWADARYDQLLEADARAGYSRTPHLGEEQVITMFLDALPPDAVRPTWRLENHRCDESEAETQHFREDVRLLQRLLLVLGGVIRGGIVEGVLEHLCSHPLLGSHRASVTWDATAGATLFTPPPLRHLLDERVRAFDLVDEDTMMDTSHPFTCTVVFERPECDWCDNTARIDGWAQQGGHRVAGNLCLECFTVRSGPLLGGGLGAYLFLPDDVPDLVRRVCNLLCSEQGRPSVYPELDDDLDDEEWNRAGLLEQGLGILEANLMTEVDARQHDVDDVAGLLAMSDDVRAHLAPEQRTSYDAAVARVASAKALLEHVQRLTGTTDSG